ncbi:MAG: MMPL family transporter [Nanobdellota archaeon]
MKLRHKLKKDDKKPSFLERALSILAQKQYRYNRLILLFFIVLTVLLGIGITNIEFESDINNEMPQDLPIYQLNNRISDSYGGQDSVLLLVELSDSLPVQTPIKDIRHPDIITFITEFHQSLEKKTLVESVSSAGSVFSQLPSSQRTSELIPEILESTGSSSFFSDDYTATMMIITADVGSDEKKLAELETTIQNELEAQTMPAGIETTITGTPSLLQTMMDFLKKDSLTTLLIAAGIIFLLLLIIERSLRKTILIFIPLSMGIIWTLGTLGWLGIKISVATAGLGAMLLGLGVEYGVFIHTRYIEERDSGKNQLQSLKTAVPSVGSAMIGSGSTTIVGFLALSTSIMPMLQHLGQSLALGIVYCLIGAIVLAPTIFITQENISYALTKKKYHRYKHKKTRQESTL